MLKARPFADPWGLVLIVSLCLQAKLRTTPPYLLALPDSALELIAMYASPASAAQLQISCQHLRGLLSDER